MIAFPIAYDKSTTPLYLRILCRGKSTRAAAGSGFSRGESRGTPNCVLERIFVGRNFGTRRLRLIIKM
eukprot:353625-Rhodomonas_salina.1